MSAVRRSGSTFRRPIRAGIDRYNRVLSGPAVRYGAPLVELRTVLLAESYEEMPVDLYDFCHLRPRGYPTVGANVAGDLKS